MTTNTPPSPAGRLAESAESAESARITLTLTPEQAQAVCEALDTYTRLTIGQLEVVSGLVRFGVIPQGHAGTREREQGQDNPRELASAQTCDQVEELLGSAKAALGYYRNGNNGIGHPHVHITGLRAYEALKALSQAVAIQRDPKPKFRGVNYDGLLVRYTQDPAPVAAAHAGSSPAACANAAPGSEPGGSEVVAWTWPGTVKRQFTDSKHLADMWKSDGLPNVRSLTWADGPAQNNSPGKKQ